MAVAGSSASDGFDAFYAASYPSLLALLAALSGGEEDAEAIVQDAYVRLLSAWERVRHYDDPAAWVRQAAVRRLISARRRSQVARRAVTWLVPKPVPTPSADRVDVEAALRALPMVQRAVLVLHHGAGL